MQPTSQTLGEELANIVSAKKHIDQQEQLQADELEKEKRIKKQIPAAKQITDLLPAKLKETAKEGLREHCIFDDVDSQPVELIELLNKWICDQGLGSKLHRYMYKEPEGHLYDSEYSVPAEYKTALYVTW